VGRGHTEYQWNGGCASGGTSNRWLFLVQNRTATISIPAELMGKIISKIKELCEMLVVMSLAECSMDR
jgi:hypothetical protein